MVTEAQTQDSSTQTGTDVEPETVTSSTQETKTDTPTTEVVSQALSPKQIFQITALLEEAKLYEAKGAFSTPKGGNAMEAYQKILAIDPNHEKALARLASIKKN